MGSEYNPSKPHYDISLSKRTRKPWNLEKDAEKACSPENKENPSTEEGVNDNKEEDRSASEGKDHQNDHKSLKQLIKDRSPLGQHFTEEKQQQQELQMVVKKHEEDLDGSSVKCKTLVSHYARVLSRLIKIKRDPRTGSRKKQVLRLTM